MKTCTKCHEEKTLDQFAPDKRNKDGLEGRCRACNYLRTRAHQATQSGQETITRYRKSPKGAIVYKAKSHRYRAKKLEQDCGCATPAVLRALLDAWEMKCVYCGAEAEHLDHLEPISRGGLHCVENLRPACAQHNLSKGARDLLVFLQGDLSLVSLVKEVRVACTN